MQRLTDQRIVITGSSRSLGREFALACAQQGARLVLNGTNEGALDVTVSEVRDLGAEAVGVAGSVAEEAVAAELVKCCVAAYGGIDVMVCNAGIVRDRTLLKMTAEEFDEVIAVDLRGPFLCMRQAARAMVDQGGGHIIHITSASGLIGNFGQANYVAAKAGLMGMTYTAVKELKKKGVRVNAMWPVARTDMTQPLIEQAGKPAAELGFGEAPDVAQGLVLLASEACRDWNGQCLTFNGYRTALWQSPVEKHILEADSPLTLEQLEAHYRDVAPLPVYSRQPARNW